MKLGDVLFGRKKLKDPAGERLFALTTAAVTLDTSCGLKPAGKGAVIFKPLSAGEFAQAQTDIDQLLQSVALGAAILGCLAAGTEVTGYAQMSQAIHAMAHQREDLIYRPDLVARKKYDKIYQLTHEQRSGANRGRAGTAADG